MIDALLLKSDSSLVCLSVCVCLNPERFFGRRLNCGSNLPLRKKLLPLETTSKDDEKEKDAKGRIEEEEETSTFLRGSLTTAE